MKNTAIVVAGGHSQRFNSAIPKQFLKLGDKPLVFHALHTFEQSTCIDDLILVLPNAYQDHFSNELLPKHPLSKLKHIVAGGQTRQESTQKGFEVIEPNTDFVFIHDAARPFVGSQTIAACLEAAKKVGAAIAAAPVVDTLKKVSPDQHILETIDRKNLYQAQTPQVFRYDLLKEVLDWAKRATVDATDEASLFEQFGKEVLIVPTDAINFKITHQSDWDLAEALLEFWADR